MKITCDWLREYVDYDWHWPELVERLTKAGLELEGVVDMARQLEGVIVGHVLEVEAHPDADRLRVCLVDLAGGSRSEDASMIVCGASNVAVGQRVPVITPGHELPDGTAIKRARIRGVESAGMICSEADLGLGEDASGILALPESCEIGAPFAQAAGITDVVIDFEVTPNRPDCLSLVGIAREVAVLNGSSLKLPPVEGRDVGEPTASATSIELEDAVRCPRYVGRLIRGVTVGSSPRWLNDRLRAVGIRPINNIVDATNYVMLELGQPLHAFDFAKLDGGRIVVRRACPGETLETLDGVSHELSGEALIIADGSRPVALAGIMGGANSEVSPGTTDVLLESAYFDATAVRATANRLGTYTEASTRFERGTDWDMPPVASARAARLIANIAGGQIAPEPIDAYPQPLERRTIPLRMSRLQSLLGVRIEHSKCRRILIGLGCDVNEPPSESPCPAAEVATAKLEVSAPSFRPDLSREVDLIEELGRIYGYDEVEPDEALRGPAHQSQFSRHHIQHFFKRRLTGRGLDEVVTNSIVARAWMTGDCVELENPPIEGQSVLRNSLLPSLADVARRNLNQRARSVAIFECGRRFAGSGAARPREDHAIAGLLCGLRDSSSWRQEQSSFDYLDLKGLLDMFLEELEPRFEPAMSSFFRTGSCAAVLVKDVELGVYGEASSELARSFDLEQHPVYIFELDFAGLATVWDGRERSFRPLPKFPPVERDLAVIVSQSTLAGAVANEIRSVDTELIVSVELFDVYEGDAIDAGCRSLGFSIRLRSPEATLTDVQADEVIERVLARLSSAFGAKLRES